MLPKRMLLVWLPINLFLVYIEPSKLYIGECSGKWPESWLCEYRRKLFWEKKTWCDWMEWPTIERSLDWRKVSQSAPCDDQTSACSRHFKVEIAVQAENNFEIPMDLDKTVNSLLKKHIGSGPGNQEEGRLIGENGSKLSIVTCKIDSGYQAEVWMGVELETVAGKMRTLQKEWDAGKYRDKSQHCHELESSIVLPVKSTSDNQLMGSFECRQRPIADVSELKLIKNLIGLTSGTCEFDLVEAALDKIVRIVPSENSKLFTTAKGCGKKVYARAWCFNIKVNYQSTCRACIKHARENILARAGNARGVNWRLNDCQLRFEFYHFDSNY